MTELAIIGIDAQYADQDNIDRVERAFYQGRVSSSLRLRVPLSLAELCITSVKRLTNVDRLQLSDVAVMLVLQNGGSKNKTQADCFQKTLKSLQQTLDRQFCSLSIFSGLGEALTQANKRIIETNAPVALVGVHLLDSEDSKGANVHELKATISYDDTFKRYHQVEGVAGLLLSSVDFAANNKATIYSKIMGFDAVTSTSDGTFFTDGAGTQTKIVNSISKALSNANVSSMDVELLEVSALANREQSNVERLALLNAYEGHEKLSTAVTCVRSLVGDSGGFAQVAGLLKCVFSLHQHYIPAISDWQKPHDSDYDDWLSSPFYFPVEARTWFPNKKSDANIAAFSCLTENDYCHVLLQETVHFKETEILQKSAPETSQNSTLGNEEVRSNGYMACSDLSLFLLDGHDEEALLTALSKLEQACEVEPLADIAKKCYESLSRTPPVYCAALIAESKDELLLEISQAKVGISKAINENIEWKTPKGSYFSANTVGGQDNIAFLYPGIGATYIGLGRDLFHLFPQIYAPVVSLADDIALTLKDRLLNPRAISRLSAGELKKRSLALRGSLSDIAECGVGYACVFTKIFENVFNVEADFSAGYSMGEVSMYAALGCWEQPGLMSSRLAHSETFNHRLCGELQSLSEYWNLPVTDVKSDGTTDATTDVTGQTETHGKIWETYTVAASIEDVNVALAGEERVYCTIINTTEQLLLAGYPADCERVIKKLGRPAIPLNMANAIHSEPAYREYEHMEKLFTMNVTERIGTKMYSSSCYLPVAQFSKTIANSISKCLCERVDFPRLVKALYDQGARVFIEMGPGRSLCGWIDDILDKSSPETGNLLETDNLAETKGTLGQHLCVPVNAKGTSDELMYVRTLAKLVCHGVKVDLNSFFYGSIIVQK